MSTSPGDTSFEDSQRLPAERLASAWFDLDQSGISDHVHGPELDITQNRILTLICELESCPVSDLRSRLQVDPSTTSRAISRLVDAGLAVRRRHMADRRMVLVSPTQAGRAHHDSARRRTEDLMTAALEGLDQADWEPLIRNVELFAGQASKYLSLSRPNR
ncbi:MAG: MarR family transcriptional regulator [Actinomycetia bacterium]|nr:MarR family transcriptional regulator [Actinomycetes bacterium]